ILTAVVVRWPRIDDDCRKATEETMAEPIPSLGELEVRVLRLIWREQPCAERRVTELIQEDRPVARTTVLKTIQRLEEKGLLVREAGEGRGPIRYRAALEERSVLPVLVRRFVE